MNNSIKTYKEVCKILGVKPEKVNITEETPENTTLVIVPDQVFTWSKIKKLAVEFGKKQPYETYIYEDLYKLYSAEELSGKPTGNGYRYLFIPDEHNVKSDTVKNQKKTDGRVPSVLEAICFWYALRENNKPMNFDSTYIRHFDLPEEDVDGDVLVPYSGVYDVGEPGLAYSFARNGNLARVSVGSKLEPQSSPSPLDTSLLQANTEAILKLTDTLERIFK